MTVIIGVDPHKASHTAVALDAKEGELARRRVRSGVAQAKELLSWASAFPDRAWAIESAGGLGYLLAQQLVAFGEEVLDVPATLASRVRVLGTGRSNKNDPNDATAVAVAALRSPGLRQVAPVGHREILRLLVKRNYDLGRLRGQAVGRAHALAADLVGGGIGKEMYASDLDRFLDRVRPSDEVEKMRVQLLEELLDDICYLDKLLKASHLRIREAVRASGTSLTDIYGIGPILAASLLGYSGDVSRFVDRDHYASYNGTAPVEFSSGGRVVHRLSRRGNRNLNHAIHMVAVCQLRQRGSEGRAYFDRRVAEGKTKREALRALKRQISNTVYRHLVEDTKRSSRT